MSVSRFGALMLVLATVSGCYRVHSRLIQTLEPPEDLYRCLQLELGRAGYAIVGADRGSGWLHAQRRIERLMEVVQAEIYATVISEDGDGAHLQLTDNSHASRDAEHILAQCTPQGTPGSV